MENQENIQDTETTLTEEHQAAALNDTASMLTKTPTELPAEIVEEVVASQVPETNEIPAAATLPSSVGLKAPEDMTGKPFVRFERDGVTYEIGGRHFNVDGKDLTAEELLFDEHSDILDRWVKNKSGILREVF